MQKGLSEISVLSECHRKRPGAAEGVRPDHPRPHASPRTRRSCGKCRRRSSGCTFWPAPISSSRTSPCSGSRWRRKSRTYYSDAAGEAGISLKLCGAAAVAADEALFRRALSNLIANSLAYTPPGGVIEVLCRYLTETEGEVTVRDSGSGIAPEHLPRIFDRFYRASGSGAKGADGTGLSLAIVKAIVQMHSGSVAIRSAPGAGTEVTLTFAAAGAQRTQGAPGPAGKDICRVI